MGKQPLGRRVECCENCGALVSDKRETLFSRKYVRGHVHYWAGDGHDILHSGLVCCECLMGLDPTDDPSFCEYIEGIASEQIAGWPSGKRVNRNLGIASLQIGLLTDVHSSKGRICADLLNGLKEWADIQHFRLMFGMVKVERDTFGWNIFESE